jgi:hypothetical protein
MDRARTGPGRRPWVGTLLAGTLVVAAGLATARSGTGALGDALGDALYAVLVLLVVGLLLPRAGLGVRAAVAVVLCWAVEVAQATGAPAAAAAAWPPLRYLLGTTFAWADLLWYALGVLAAAAVMAGTSRVARGRVAARDRS